MCNGLFFFQAEDGIRDLVRSRGLGDVYKRQPHGREWKSEFGNHLNVFVEMNIFPEELNKYLKEYSSDPSAASCSDEKLIKHLKKYDDVSDLSLIHI